MAKSILFILIPYFAFQDVASKPVEDALIIEGINFQYENGNWICGDMECPANTFGCKILLKTNTEDRKTLQQIFSCFDKDKKVILEAGDTIELNKAKKIDIELETYNGAESRYTSGYGSGGHENAKGVLAVDGLYVLKENARRTKIFTENITSQVSRA